MKVHCYLILSQHCTLKSFPNYTILLSYLFLLGYYTLKNIPNYGITWYLDDIAIIRKVS